MFEGYNTQATDLLTSETTEITLEGLRPFQLYQCTVAAETVDEGPHSVAVFVTTAEDGEICSGLLEVSCYMQVFTVFNSIFYLVAIYIIFPTSILVRCDNSCMSLDMPTHYYLFQT